MRRLYIEDFGPVSKAELELRDLNIFIGEQSIGKSTIAKLITILTDYYNLSMLVTLGEVGWVKHLQSYNLLVYDNDNYLIRYDLEEKEIRFHIEISKNNITYYVLSIAGRKITKKERVQQELMKLKPIFHEDKFSKDLLSVLEKHKEVEVEKFFSSLQQLMYNSLYIPAERIVYSLFNKLQPALNLMKESVPNNLLRFMIELANAQSKYELFNASLINVKYYKDNNEDYVVDMKSGQKLPLSIASSGIQSSLPLLLVLEYAINYKEYSSLVIEEPESNLFPDKQVELFRYIIKSVKKEKRIITITTHSPYMLSAVNNSLYVGNLSNEYGKDFESICVDIPRLLPMECSIYSLGSCINGNGEYCQSLLDNETGMINMNALDGVSFKMSQEFEEIEDAYINLRKKTK